MVPWHGGEVAYRTEWLQLGKQVTHCFGREAGAKIWLFFLSGLRPRVSGTGKGVI